MVAPWKARATPTISNLPLCILASLSANSFASAPVDSGITRIRGSGASSARRSASASTGSDSIRESRWTTVSSASRTAAITRGCRWPRVEQICPEEKSSSRRPSAVSSHMPSARSTTNGANPPR